MTNLTYNLSREQAAEILDVSTRTVDRYVKKGKLSYKKVANKVILPEEEVLALKEEFDLLNNQQQSVVTTERVVQGSAAPKLATGKSAETIKEFANILEKKDKTIEEKNQLIFMLQHKIGELETKMSSMVALPDHSQQKEELQKTIQSLHSEKDTLESQVKKEKQWNVLFMGLLLIVVILTLFFSFSL